MVGENSPSEIITSVLALSAAVIGFRTLLSRRGRAYAKVLYLLPLFSLFFFLEEISYGGIYFHIKYPRFLGYELQSVHDLWPACYRALVHQDAVLGYGLLLGLMLAALPGVILLRRRYGKCFAAWYRENPCCYYFTVALGLIVSAQVFDLDLFRRQAIRFVEASLEMNGALALLFAALALARSRSRAIPD
ncbi:MAG: hypothetical protein C4524_15430 [Candidatus Zixiibacteriota bacterium]|nr:MAG: hypothetical protein C4524_15430 [candidate division Zixibacteria bacterium]